MVAHKFKKVRKTGQQRRERTTKNRPLFEHFPPKKEPAKFVELLQNLEIAMEIRMKLVSQNAKRPCTYIYIELAY